MWMWAASALYVLIFGVISFGYWRVGGYGVETDALGGYLPETQKLLDGQFTTLDGFKGPGYHLAVAGVGLIARDLFVAAKIIALLSAGAVLLLLLHVIGRHFGALVAWVAAIVVATNAQFALYSIQVGTDMYFLALSVATATLILGGRDWRRALAAGGLAGLAYLTRYNGIFLIVSGLVILLLAQRDARPWKARLARTGAFVGAAFVVILPWSLFTWSRGKGFFYNTNYLNIAYELYGRDRVSWDQFWEYFNPAFRSFGEAVAGNPGGFLFMALRNGIEHLWLDWRRVLVAGDAPWARPAAILWGLLALIGFVATAWRYRWRAWPAIFLGLMAYGVLVPVFYGERFSLPMVPIYGVLAGIAVAQIARRKEMPLYVRSAPAVGLAFLLWGAVVGTVRSVEALLQYSPEEVRLIADATHHRVAEGQRVLARKPHIAYFLGLEYVRMPIFENLDDLPRVARENHARYLFVSGIEAALRPPLAPLLDPRNAPPYLKPLAATTGQPAVLYEFTIDIPPPPPPRSAQALALEGPLPPQKVRLGRAYLAAGRADLAYEQFTAALRENGDRADVQRGLGEALLAAGKRFDAIGHLERSYGLDPTSAETRAALARAYDAAGDTARAAALRQARARQTGEDVRSRVGGQP